MKRRRVMFKRNKYGAKRTPYRGVVYDSKMESDYAKSLDRMVAAGLVDKWERQVQFPLVVNGALVARYVADFRVLRPDGASEVHEVKGRWTAGSKAKLRLFEALYPDIPLVVIGAKYVSVWKASRSRRGGR